MSAIREHRWRKRDHLKRAIYRWLKHNNGAGELDVAIVMRIGLSLACDICDELVKEGKILRRAASE